MPVIAAQNRKDPDFTPGRDWPVTCQVQWGDRGVVLKRAGGGYRTAFFEAFPKEGGFFRGEGTTVAEAEGACFEKWQRYARCDHQWGRGFHVETRGVETRRGVTRPRLRGRTKYTNGGAICTRCKAFATVFHPITRLGAWRDPPDDLDLVKAIEGHLRPAGIPELDRPQWRRLDRRSELRMRAAGIDLPETPDTPSPLDPFEDPDKDPYARACKRAVVDWIRENGLPENGSEDGMSGLFASLERKQLEAVLAEAEDEHPSSETSS